jgi:hypothetical protein
MGRMLSIKRTLRQLSFRAPAARPEVESTASEGCVELDRYLAYDTDIPTVRALIIFGKAAAPVGAPVADEVNREAQAINSKFRAPK